MSNVALKGQEVFVNSIMNPVFKVFSQSNAVCKMTTGFVQILNKCPSNRSRSSRLNIYLATAEKKDWMSQNDTGVFKRNMS